MNCLDKFSCEILFFATTIKPEVSLSKSDLGDLHDHYWSYITIMLKGGYWETTEKGTFWRKPGYIGFRSYNSRHSLKIPEGKCAWTLLLVGPKRSVKMSSKYSNKP